MFFFRLNRILIHSNLRRTMFKRRDKADVEIYCFITSGSKPLPALKGLTAAIKDEDRDSMIKKAVQQALESRVFTPVENVKDDHVLTFGDTGFVLYTDDEIPDDFHFQMVIIGSRGKQRNTAKMLLDLEKDSELGNLLKSAGSLIGASNPAVAIGSEIGKYLTKFILRQYADKDDDQLGLVYQSWNRMEHYPHGERKRDGNKDLTGNIEYDYSLFGFEKPKRKPSTTPKRSSKKEDEDAITFE
jgi:hypothetical protein